MASISDGESGNSARTKINASIAITDAISSTGSGSIITTAERNKLSGISESADVTDATTVNAAGATMNTDTDVSANSWVIDEDNMASDLATKVPTQQSVKAYADTKLSKSGGSLTGDVDVNGNNITGYTVSKVLTSDASGNIAAATASTTELSYIEGVTSNIQTQIDSKQDELTGLTASVTELNYTDGVTSAIQTQLDAKASLSGATFTGEVSVSNSVPVFKLNDTNGATDESKTNISSNQGALRIQHISDADGGGGDYAEFSRAGNNMTSLILYDNAVAKITLNNAGTAIFNGAVTVGAITLPATDGTANQVLKTDGSGTVAFGAVALSETSGDSDDITEGAANLFLTTSERSKLTGIEASADVTDATNVDAAGAVMNTDTSTAAMSFVIDEDNMASNSATKVPTQQSVKAYADTMLPLAGGRMSGTLNMDGSSISNGGTIYSDSFVLTQQTLTAASTTTFNVSEGNNASLALNTTIDDFTFSNIAAGQKYTLKITISGVSEITWNSIVKWAGGTAPTLSSTDTQIDILEFYSDGTNVFGKVFGQNFS